MLFQAAAKVGEKLEQGGEGLELGSLLVVAALCLGLHSSGLLLGMWTSSWWRFDRPTRIAVGFACSQKTLPVALLVFQQYYQGLSLAVVPLMFYHFGQLVVDTFVADSLAPGSVSLEAEPAVD
jgi:sodium/bile acid cotransporter 7